MRKQLLAIFLPLLVLVLLAAGQNQSTGTGPTQHTALQKVEVLRGEDGVSVQISTRNPVTPALATLQSPDRLVISLPATVMASAQSHIAVESAEIKDVRIGMDGKTPPTTSIVLDLQQPCKYELVPGAGSKLIVKLHAGAAPVKTAQSAAPPVKPVATAPPPAVIGKTAKLVAAGQPLPTSASASVAKDPSSSQVSSKSSAAATPFVYIEPSYKPKDGTSQDQLVPSTRAAGAAERFVEKPEGSLLPAPSAAPNPQAAPATLAPIQPAVNLAAEQKAQAQQPAPVTAPKYTGEPISVNLKDVDLKDFFRLIHEISGLNVVLDPNVKGTLTIVLDDVPWDQALDIVLKNNDLARQLEGNVLRIATVDTLRREAEARRSQQDAEALAVDKVTVTRFLSYAHSKDVVVTLKKFLTQRGDVISDDRTNAVIVSDIPSVMPGIDRLLTQLDRKTQEVEIEARVVAATRSFARDIGTQLGFGWGNNATAVGGASSVGTSPVGTFGLNPHYTVVGTAPPSNSTLSQIPLFSNLGSTSPTSGITLLNASKNIQIDAILTMAESRGLLKILSRPRVVTQNNIQALVRQGVRIPIVTQAQLGGPPTVTYVDAFLRLTVVPQITSEGTIFLNVDVENTTPNFGETIQGNPELITQQATTQVLVTDGGTVVIGGVIQTNNSININQVPLLGNIPYLGNLFKHTTVSTTNQELIFFITPRIIQT